MPRTGCAAWARAAMITVRAKSEADGLTGTLTMTLDARSGRYAVRRDYGAYTLADGFDGQLDWTQDRSGGVHALDSEPARAIATTSAWLRRQGWCAGGADGAAIEPLADENDAGVAAAVWRVTPRNGIPAILRFDRATGLLRQSEVRLWGNRLIRHFADWRDIGGGVMAPFSERDDDPEDESVETITVQAAAAKAGTTQAVFARPAPPHDYVIEGGAASTTVPYEDDGVGRIFVPVFIDGQGPYPFEVDTGGHFILTAATASALQLKAVGSANSTGAGPGILKSGSVRIHEVRIGQAVIHDESGRVLPLSAASNDRGPRPPRAGFLGLELFERFAVGLDRRAKTLTLTPLETYRPRAGGVVLPLRFTEDAPITKGSFAGFEGDFEVDSGDAGPAIVEGYWAQQHALADRLAHGLDWSGGGVGGDYRETLSRGDLTLGPIAFPHEVVSYVGVADRGAEATQVQAGVIGESSLRRFDMIYDYGREELWIDPKSDIAPLPLNRAGLRLKKDPSGQLAVALITPNSPGDAAGLKPGDQIASVNGRAAKDLSVSDALVVFSGSIGAEIALDVAPKAGGPTRSVTFRLRELLP